MWWVGETCLWAHMAVALIWSGCRMHSRSLFYKLLILRSWKPFWKPSFTSPLFLLVKKKWSASTHAFLPPRPPTSPSLGHYIFKLNHRIHFKRPGCHTNSTLNLGRTSVGCTFVVLKFWQKDSSNQWVNKIEVGLRY